MIKANWQPDQFHMSTIFPNPFSDKHKIINSKLYDKYLIKSHISTPLNVLYAAFLMSALIQYQITPFSSGFYCNFHG